MFDIYFEQKIPTIKLIVFDFDGVFTDNSVHLTEDGKEFVSCWRGDGIGLSKVKRLTIPMYVVSTEENPVVGQRCQKLKIKYIQGCNDKLKELVKLVDIYKCTLDDVLYMGNDINDLDCLNSVGLPVVVADAHPDVIPLAKYITVAYGGKGAVREICDLIFNIRTKAVQ
jgi:YrbI family 3-deoxy-D-manno-octulosonate 8-phosphate phosphatase|tara:strand:+ start:2597 stop:3103 length:507 start_codon:yes stop_codon:yes gene_type:complete